MVKKEWIDKGFVDEPIAKELDLKSEIRELCRTVDLGGAEIPDIRERDG